MAAATASWLILQHGIDILWLHIFYVATVLYIYLIEWVANVSFKTCHA